MSFLTDFIKKVKGESTTLGIDVGHHCVKIAKVTHNQNSFKLVDYGIVEVPFGTIVDGVIQNSESLGGIILNLIDHMGGVDSNTDVVLSLSWSNGVLADIVKMRTQPGMADEELILAEAGRRAPFDDPDITLDYKILNKSEESNDIDVLLVAVKNDILNRWVVFFKDAGIHPAVIDADTFGLYNALNYILENESSTDGLEESLEPESDQGPVEEKNNSYGILNLGHAKSNITFVNKGLYHSTRDIPRTSIEGVARKFARSLGVRQEKAFGIIHGETYEGITDEMIEQAYRDAFEDLAMDTQQMFNYFKQTGGKGELSLYLCGGGAALAGIVEAFTERLEVPVQLLDIGKNITVDEYKFPDGLDQEVSSQLAVAISMAMRKV
ncbi:MAG: pilus assembly protein PilM [Fibrobacterales bacterium]